MKKLLRKIWNGLKERFLEAVGWDMLAAKYDFDSSGADTGQGSDSHTMDNTAASSAPDVASPTPAPTPTASDEVDFGSIEWRWGGFRGGKATLADCRIAGLRVTPNGLSYKWTVGGCEDLDRSCSHSNPCCTCALFCRVGGKWVGGKFDHISTDRRTRGFENIDGRYGGWEPKALSKATAFAFVILDDGAKRRTNVIVQEGGVR